jgi:hypothetical protein
LADNAQPEVVAMTLGKFLLRTIVIAVALFALGFVGHQLLLGRDYAAIEPIIVFVAEILVREFVAPILLGILVAVLSKNDAAYQPKGAGA